MSIYDDLDYTKNCSCGKSKCNCKRPKSCGSDILLSARDIRWTAEETEFIPILPNQSLETILENIDSILQNISAGDVNIQNIGNGSGLYAGISISDYHQFKTLIAGQGITITEQPQTVTISSNDGKIQIGTKRYFYDSNPSDTIIVAYNVWLTDNELHSKIQYNGTGDISNPDNWTSISDYIEFS